jgi:hypothetical protein
MCLVLLRLANFINELSASQILLARRNYNGTLGLLFGAMVQPLA